jgi:hypothetical protein
MDGSYSTHEGNGKYLRHSTQFTAESQEARNFTSFMRLVPRLLTTLSKPVKQLKVYFCGITSPNAYTWTDAAFYAYPSA